MLMCGVPVIFSFKGCRYFFFSNEGDPREPIHVHVRKDEKLAKFWIKPQVQVSESFGFSAKELNEIRKIIDNRKKEILEAWNDHFES